MNSIERLKKKLNTTRRKPMNDFDGLSSGSTLLNLACSGDPHWAFAKGGYYFFVGDSNSGKTWVSMAALAEASINPRYKDYRLIYDGPEGGAKMDMKRYFASLIDRLEAPARDEDSSPLYSSTVQEFYDHLDDACNDARPFVYVLDSMDVLDSEDAQKKAKQNKSIRRKQKESREIIDMKGSYGDGKAKENSQKLRRFMLPLEKMGSILLIINQTRDNIGFTARFQPKIRSGGNALEFYASIQIWSSIRQRIKKLVRGKPRHIGNLCRMQIKRSRFTGREVSVDIPIFFSAGIDDTGSLIDWLVEEKHWTKQKGKTKEEYSSDYKLNASEFKFSGYRNDLKAKIEEEGKECELQEIVTRVWKEIEAGCSIHQKNRYL